MNNAIAYLTNMIINVISSTGYTGVFVLMTAESSADPDTF